MKGAQSLDEMNTIMWFRKGLRLHDNPALLEACQGASHVHPIFILDPHFRDPTKYRVGVNRFNFLLESLSDLDASLRARGSRLIVLRGSPAEVLPRVLKEWRIKKLCYEVDTEPYAVTRDAAAGEVADQAGAEVHARVSHTLYDTADLVRQHGGKPPLTMGAFTKLIDKVGDPPAPLDAPASVPPPLPNAPSCDEASTGVPTIAECGYGDKPTTIFKGGETVGLDRLQKSFQDDDWIAKFEKPKTNPAAFEPNPATTVLSPYLKWGCLSPRLFHKKLLEVYRRRHGHTKPPVSLRGQLLWREFFYTVGAFTPNFTKMQGNALCKQIPWQDNDAHLQAWRTGRTGYPWIDALMRQLKEWGWMHHLGRHAVACFLTRGDLYISWERGQDVFEELLIDQDTFLNAANWMWLSASSFFYQFFRVYSPITFGKKYDKDGAFIRRFVPELKNFPAKYIYEPWTAPIADQRAAGCLIGTDYPRPIVDHAKEHKECIQRMKAAYASNKSGEGIDGGLHEDDAGGSGSAPPSSQSQREGKPPLHEGLEPPLEAEEAVDTGNEKPKGKGGRKRQKTLDEHFKTTSKK